MPIYQGDLTGKRLQKHSLKKIAEHLNVKQQQYARYEKGINVMPIKYLKDICLYLNVSSDYLIGLTNEMLPITKK